MTDNVSRLAHASWRMVADNSVVVWVIDKAARMDPMSSTLGRSGTNFVAWAVFVTMASTAGMAEITGIPTEATNLAGAVIALVLWSVGRKVLFGTFPGKR